MLGAAVGPAVVGEAVGCGVGEMSEQVLPVKPVKHAHSPLGRQLPCEEQLLDGLQAHISPS